MFVFKLMTVFSGRGGGAQISHDTLARLVFNHYIDNTGPLPRLLTTAVTHVTRVALIDAPALFKGQLTPETLTHSMHGCHMVLSIVVRVRYSKEHCVCLDI